MRRFCTLAVGIAWLLAGDVQARHGSVRTQDGLLHEGNVVLSPLGGLLVSLLSGGSALVPVANIANARFDGTTSPITNAAYRFIVFRNGSILPARIERATVTFFFLESGGTKLKASVLDVAGVLSQQRDPSQVPALTSGRTGVALRNGDFIDGDFLSCDGSQVAINSVIFGVRRVDLDKDGSAVVLRALPPNASRYQIRTVNGSVYCSKQAPAIGAGDVLVVADPLLGETRVPFHEVLEIRTAPAGRNVTGL